jgi:ubiquinone/menaquinone biosynthesis C-methylase UbiE
MEQLKTFFAGKSIRNVLDIGTGSGDFIKLIRPFFPTDAQITGVDPSEDALTEARKGVESTNVRFVRMEGEKLEFEDQSFDVVCLSNAMHHLADPAKTFSEMKRVVKSDGWLVIAEIVSDGLNVAQENQKMLHHFRSYVDRKSGITHRETWTEAEVLEIIGNNGIRTVHSFPFNRMGTPITDPEKLQAWVDTFAGHLKQLQGLDEYDERALLFDLFKERVAVYGFQLARQVVIIGQAKK